MSLARSDTFGEHVYIPPTDDDDDSPDQTSSCEPTHNQPTAPRYMHRMLRAYHASPTGETTALKKPDSFHSLTHWFVLYVYAVNGRDDNYLGPKNDTTESFSRPDENLQNICMDAIREYFRLRNLAATPFRIEYLYKSLPNGEGDLMKKFLLQTVAWRLTKEGPSTGFKSAPPEPLSIWVKENTASNARSLSPSFLHMLDRNHDICRDFCIVMSNVSIVGRDAMKDARQGPTEKWHVGSVQASDGGVKMQRESSKDSGYGDEMNEMKEATENLRNISLGSSVAAGA
ncbi:hypothetical protein EJ05DRAFT_501222 [Pseudovirgaria hyperparasitica]|uniref:Uncharacterized protein n=1 Tax=Pseudovirgaria hyperparasitica TaxID=470096 RepID=A0A6A6W436_9PEZI|nr:uncharacterized protein EJ05DRAFT_501222 [Pseudovirgaria hyperparasitica]KAF2757698.1 hypothetical protein EJ05DRAFT_501222 [Pseudovirgaria hyperparasitica]